MTKKFMIKNYYKGESATETTRKFSTNFKGNFWACFGY